MAIWDSSTQHPFWKPGIAADPQPLIEFLRHRVRELPAEGLSWDQRAIEFSPVALRLLPTDPWRGVSRCRVEVPLSQGADDYFRVRISAPMPRLLYSALTFVFVLAVPAAWLVDANMTLGAFAVSAVLIAYFVVAYRMTAAFARDRAATVIDALVREFEHGFAGPLTIRSSGRSSLRESRR